MELKFFSRESPLSKKLDLIFMIIGGILLLITISVFVSSIRFLVEHVNNALDTQTKHESVTTFRVEALSKLGISIDTTQASETNPASSTQP